MKAAVAERGQGAIVYALERAISLARLALQFGRVERATRHEDGVRPETDSDHTVMLALVACDLAPHFLNRSRIAELCIVHDLVEAYAGDTQTLVIDAEGRAAKEVRERAARDRILLEFGTDSWLGATLLAYEAQSEPEARWVRILDKALPKLTHLFNGCAAARRLTDRRGFLAAHDAQLQRLLTEHGDDQQMRLAVDLVQASMVACEVAWEVTR